MKGHERAINSLKYNREGQRSILLLRFFFAHFLVAGDLIFTCSKDNKPTVWYADNGERLGTYKGHNGAVWSLDVSYYSEWLLTASGTCPPDYVLSSVLRLLCAYITIYVVADRCQVTTPPRCGMLKQARSSSHGNTRRLLAPWLSL